MYTTGDKLLNVMKEEEIGIAELSRISGVPERTILDIMAGVKEPSLVFWKKFWAFVVRANANASDKIRYFFIFATT